MKRRDLIKYLSVAPIAGAVVGTGVPFKSLADAPVKAVVQRDLIKELGLRVFINGAGTYTTHTASLMHPDTMAAINSASRHFVMINDVQDAVGKKIAEICHAEAAMVTAGCYSALILGAAGVLTGMDRKKVFSLPDVSKFDKNEVIVQRGQNVGYIHAIMATGFIPVVIDTAEQAEKAVNSKTALMYFLNEAQRDKNGVNKDIDPIMHAEWLAIAKKHNIPTIIDIAADVPPVENLWKYNDMGFSLVCLSGGKGLHGPQSAGILMGKKDLIAAARLNGPPNGDNIGRGMKVNKEEMLGMYAALDAFVKLDHDKVWKMWEAQVAVIKRAADKYKGVKTNVVVPEIANHTPKLDITFDPAIIKVTSKDIIDRLRAGFPSIETVPGNALSFTVWMMQPGEEIKVAKRLSEELAKVTKLA